jgi:D-alanyl-D-alanine carboxypeptidase
MLPSGNDAAYTLAEYFGYLGQLLIRNKRIVFEETLQARRLDLTGTNTNTFVQ